ncbi:MAG: hypothetical protein NW201_14075 [Gemmatimonadales bacterium]|nr:hypothetical protein [Gemmatimonadales bacterium]
MRRLAIAGLLAAAACGGPRRTPEAAPPPPFSAITAGEYHTCALDRDGLAWCWGINQSGQLGDSTITDRLRPVRVAGGIRFALLEAGGAHTCGLSVSGELWCWGRNVHGELGDGTVEMRSTPVRAVPGERFRSLAVGYEFTCGLRTDSVLLCWGADDTGQLGDGDERVAERYAPVTVKGPLRVGLARAGRHHACALDTGGHAWCWGSGGPLGDGTLETRRSPVRVKGAVPLTQLAIGAEISCGIGRDARAWCWGPNIDGQLGTGLLRPTILTPGEVAGRHRWTALAAGRYRVCGLDEGKRAWCWGSNYLGALGDGSGRDHDVPVRVAADRRYVAITLGETHGCALDTDGIAWCWGMNVTPVGAGMLGDGTGQSRSVPVRVGGAPEGRPGGQPPAR